MPPAAFLYPSPSKPITLLVLVISTRSDRADPELASIYDPLVYPTNYYLRPVEDVKSHLHYQGDFQGSGTLKIVIPVENHPQKRCFRLADYHAPLGGGG